MRHLGPAKLRIIHYFLVSLLLCACTHAYAQPGDVRCPTVGTILKFSTGTIVEATGTEPGYVCTFQRVNNDRKLRLILGFNTEAPLFGPHLDKLRSLIPLRVGKSVSIPYAGAGVNGKQDSWINTITIDRKESIHTPAGMFESYLLLWAEQTTSYSGRWERHLWYSPQVGHIVKANYKNIKGTPVEFPAPSELVEMRVR